MNLMDLMIAIGVDDNASSELSKITGNAQKTAQNLGNGIANAVKVGTAAIAGMTAGVGALTKLSIDGFSQYEQLAGGVETLFKDSADKIKAFSDNAYKTAGMSANEYMDTAIKSSAALIRSLNGDTAKAAEIADMAITDMADNANKMGTAIESLQNAYTGFSRGNFTMLDNLALGFSGTKEGMEELLATAKELTGIDYNIDSYADIVQAIHAVQEEMEITGTTAREAAGTISGSVASAESAWNNLLTGFADGNADLGTLTDNLVESVSTVADNLLPRIGQAVDGIITSFGELVGVDLSGVVEKVSAFGDKTIAVAKDIIGAFKEGGVFGVFGEITEMFQTVTGIDVSFITDKFEAIGNAVQYIKNTIGVYGWESGLTAFIDSFRELAGVDISGVVNGIVGFVEKVQTAAPHIIESVGGAIEGILAPFRTPEASAVISAISGAVSEFVGWILDADFSWIESVGEAIGIVIKPLVNASTEVIENVKNGVKSFLELIFGSDKASLADIGNSIVRLFGPFTSSLADIIKTVTGHFENIMSYAKESGFGDNLRIIANAAVDLFGSFAGDVGNAINAAADAFGYFLSFISKDVVDNSGTIAENLSKILNVIKEITSFAIGGTADFITGSIDMFKALSEGDIEGAIKGAEKAYDSLVGHAYDTGKAFTELIGGEVDEAPHRINASDMYVNILPSLPNTEKAADLTGRNIASGVKQGIVEGLSSDDPTLRRGFQNLEDEVKDINEINSPSRRYARIGRFMAQGIAVGWMEAFTDVRRSITDSMDVSTGTVDFASSATGKSSAGMLNSMLAAADEDGRSFEVNVYLDGEVVARNQYKYLRDIARQKGEPVNA